MANHRKIWRKEEMGLLFRGIEEPGEAVMVLHWPQVVRSLLLGQKTASCGEAYLCESSPFMASKFYFIYLFYFIFPFLISPWHMEFQG